MIEVSGFIQYRGVTPQIAKKKLNGILKESWEEVGEHFIEVNLPRRFTYAGGKMLGYAVRTRAYNRNKKKRNGNVYPFVWSGETRQNVLNNARANAIGQGKSPRVEIPLHARILNYLPKYRDEIRRIADKEVGPLERVMQKSMETKFKSLNDNKKVEVS